MGTFALRLILILPAIVGVLLLVLEFPLALHGPDAQFQPLRHEVMLSGARQVNRLDTDGVLVILQPGGQTVTKDGAMHRERTRPLDLDLILVLVFIFTTLSLLDVLFVLFWDLLDVEVQPLGHIHSKPEVRTVVDLQVTPRELVAGLTKVYPERQFETPDGALHPPPLMVCLMELIDFGLGFHVGPETLEQTVLPNPAALVPLGHLRQPIMPCPGCIYPGGQDVHLVEPAEAANLPAEQRVQLRLPVLSAYDPAEHLLQTEFPGKAENFPTEQGKQIPDLA